MVSSDQMDANITKASFGFDHYYEKQSQLLSNYLNKNQVFVVDPSSKSRRRLFRVLFELGADPEKVSLHRDFYEAEEDMKNKTPSVIISDYHLGSRSGLDLIQTQREMHPQPKNCLFILVTANSYQTTIAKAAEEDVDTFVLKPYEIETLVKTLVSSSVAKLFPDQYRKMIESGKRDMEEGNYDQAISCFQAAIEMHDRPSLAYAYMAKTEEIKSSTEGAKEHYRAGLQYNKIHFKCLMGLFELLMNEKNYNEAYEVIKKIIQYYPSNPKRLTTVIRLSIMTHQFQDIESHYQLFKRLNIQDQELIKYICAGLIVTGKYYLSNGVRTRALELFESAAYTANGEVKILRKIIHHLVEYKLAKEAYTFLKQFPQKERKGLDYRVSQYLIEDQFTDSKESVHIGKKLIREGLHDPSSYRLLISRLLETDKVEDAKEVAARAKRYWPEETSLVDALFDGSVDSSY